MWRFRKFEHSTRGPFGYYSCGCRLPAYIIILRVNIIGTDGRGVDARDRVAAGAEGAGRWGDLAARPEEGKKILSSTHDYYAARYEHISI